MVMAAKSVDVDSGFSGCVVRRICFEPSGGGRTNSGKRGCGGSKSTNIFSQRRYKKKVIEKIDKMEKLIIEGKVTFVDDEGKHLKNVDYSGDHDSEDEVASVDNDMTNFLASKKDGYGTNSLLEQ
ncbi:hypothetical protein Tco_0741152 [Tanacetum coccineum]